MSKTFALSLVLAASLGLTACSKSETENASNAVNEAAANAEAAADNAVNAAGNLLDNASNAAGNLANDTANAM
ncbi:MAG: circumsporozoite protein [Sphingobium sp.]